VLFLTERGISYTQIGTLDSIFAIIVIGAEAPTGYLGDRIGRRNSLLIGAALGTVGSVAFAFASSFGPFVLLYAVFAIEQTFRSGTESAWLYDILDERFDTDQFSAVRGRGKALGTVTGGLAAVAGGALGSVHLGLPWVVSGCSTAVAFLILLTFPETDRTGADTFTPATAVKILREQLYASTLVPFVLYVGAFYAVIVGLNYLVQPVATASGISVAQIGLLYGGFSALSAGLSAASGWFEREIGSQTWFRVVPLGLGATFAVILPLRWVAIPAFFLMRGVTEVSNTLEQQYLNDRIEEAGRATVLSTISLVHSVIAIPFQLSVGGTADALGARPTAGVFGVVLLCVAGTALLASNVFGNGVLRSDGTTIDATETTDD
jgi:MFS family permease